MRARVILSGFVVLAAPTVACNSLLGIDGLDGSVPADAGAEAALTIDASLDDATTLADAESSANDSPSSLGDAATDVSIDAGDANASLDADRAPTCFPVPAGIVSWWRGEGNADDAVGPNAGTSTSVTYAAGKVGMGFHFSAVTPGYIQASATGLPIGSDDRTMEAWVRVGMDYGTALEGLFMGYGTWGVHGALNSLLVYGTSNPVTFSQWGGTLQGGTLTLNSWHHVAIVLSTGGSQPTLTLYLDGAMTATGSTTGNLMLDTPDGGTLYLGGLPNPPDGTPEWLVGDVDEAAVYARALSADEIRGIYEAGSLGKCP